MSQTSRRQITGRVDDSLHTRIKAQVLDGILSMLSEADSPEMAAGYVTEAVIRELDGEFLDFGAWLAEELTGRTLTRINLESCLKDWKDCR